MSNRKTIIQAFVARLAAIQVANGFATDIGLQYFVGETPTLGADDPEAALAVLIGAEQPQWQGKKCYITLPIDVHVIVPAGASAYAAQEDAIADVKRAIEVDHDLGGLLSSAGQFPLRRGAIRPLPRESGSTEVGAVLPYEASFTEGWGAP